MTILILDNQITSLDFNPSGEIVATLDRFGNFLLSDLDTLNYNFHLDLGNMETLDEGKPYSRMSLVFDDEDMNFGENFD